ncbi:MAG TPA: chaperonin GroEL [Chthoniobacterales bacterium]|nr:chaperonin GroEL [Chthoniobacterales bacterium]
MPKIIRYGEQARITLAKGVEKLAKAVETTLGPRGGNAVIDRPIGTPLISRDGVSIADEIELEDRFENMGAQIAREVAKQTNQVAGDGTTTAIVLANSLIQEGLSVFNGDTNTIAVIDGIDQAVEATLRRLKELSRPVTSKEQLLSVAVNSANDRDIGVVVTEALRRVGNDGIVDVEPSPSVKTVLEIVDGFSFDRGYLSAHMANQIDSMEALLDSALICLTDHTLLDPQPVEIIKKISAEAKKPVLLVVEQLGATALGALLAARDSGQWILAVHPPEFGHWRKAVFEDIAILTGARFISKDLGDRLEDLRLADLGTAHQVRSSLESTTITGGGGDPAKIRGRRAQIQKQLEVLEQPVERDKLQERLGRMSGAIAIIRVGGATPAEQKRAGQMIEDALNAVRAATEEGVLAGGGTTFAQVAQELDTLAQPINDEIRIGSRIVQRALVEPLRCIARNSGLDPGKVIDRVIHSNYGHGFDARSGKFCDLVAEGVLDPLKVSSAALRNAASVAKLLLGAQTLIVDKPESNNPTIEPCRGGGAECYGMDYSMQEVG